MDKRESQSPSSVRFEIGEHFALQRKQLIATGHVQALKHLDLMQRELAEASGHPVGSVRALEKLECLCPSDWNLALKELGSDWQAAYNSLMTQYLYSRYRITIVYHVWAREDHVLIYLDSFLYDPSAGDNPVLEATAKSKSGKVMSIVHDAGSPHPRMSALSFVVSRHLSSCTLDCLLGLSDAIYFNIAAPTDGGHVLLPLPKAGMVEGAWSLLRSKDAGTLFLAEPCNVGRDATLYPSVWETADRITCLLSEDNIWVSSIMQQDKSLYEMNCFREDPRTYIMYKLWRVS